MTDDPGATAPDGHDAEAASVRPYLVTGGRTRPAGDSLPIEALVERVLPDGGPAGPGGVPLPRGSAAGPESRRILELTVGRYLSIAELGAHAHLPVGVVRVLVADLADAGAVRVHGLTSTLSDPADPTGSAAALRVLESVLDGISAL